MKKRFYFLFGLLLLLFSMPVFAQVTTGIGLIIPESILLFFGGIGAMVPLIISLTSYINKLINLQGFFKQALSWVIAALIGIVGWWLKLGIFNDVNLWLALLYSLCAGLVSNGIFDLPFIKSFLSFLKLEPK